MRKQIDHTADLAYEIESHDIIGLLKEIIDILFEHYKPNLGNFSKEKAYNICEPLEDFIFDTVNDWIFEISVGHFPHDMIKKDGEIVVKFKKVLRRKGEEIKALTYHLLRLEKRGEKIRTKVVFDV